MPNADILIYPAIPARRVELAGFHVREDVLYSDAKGREKSTLRKRAGEALEDLGDVLRRVLEPDETIFYIAPAQAMPGALAQFFGGWHRYSIPRTLIVLTDRRMIAIRLRKRMSGWDWNRGIQTVRWGDIASATGGGFLSRNLTLKFRNGESRQYWRFAGGDLKKVRQVIDALRLHVTGESAAAGGMVSLCPNCLAVLAPENYKCQSCGLEFKDEKTLWKRALVIPGGASFYVGANGLGVVRGIFEAIISVSILASLVALMRAPRGSPAENVLVSVVVVECAGLFVDKILAYYLALPQIRDFIPVE